MKPLLILWLLLGLALLVWSIIRPRTMHPSYHAQKEPASGQVWRQGQDYDPVEIFKVQPDGEIILEYFSADGSRYNCFSLERKKFLSEFVYLGK